MTTAQNLKDCGNNLQQLEQNILSLNPYLAKLFQESTIEAQFPITISQINFSKKNPVERGIIMLGDAAGTITPLCGNGMSMALHSSKIAAFLIADFFEGKIDREGLERGYTKAWNAQFSQRLKMGRMIQRFFGSPVLTNFFLRIFKIFPFLIKPVIQKTHGQPF
jgi:flavin-dependent dehydrogenase